MHDLIIIGGGPAALAAAVYGLSKQLKVLLIAEDVGGKVGMPRNLRHSQLAVTEASEEAVHLFERAVSVDGASVVRDRAVDVTLAGDHFEVVTQQHAVESADTVIVATGVTPVTLAVPGAHEWVGYGLGYSPTTYGPLLAGKTVAVVGSTPRALRGAAELARTAAQLYLLLPESAPPVAQLLVALRRRPNVTVITGCRITALLGTDRVEQLSLVQDGDESFIPVEAVFADLGLLPHSEMVRRIAPIDENGFILVDDRQATTIPGLFAAGDVTTTLTEQIVVALGSGTRAAVSAYDYLLARADERTEGCCPAGRPLSTPT